MNELRSCRFIRHERRIKQNQRFGLETPPSLDSAAPQIHHGYLHLRASPFTAPTAPFAAVRLGWITGKSKLRRCRLGAVQRDKDSTGRLARRSTFDGDYMPRNRLAAGKGTRAARESHSRRQRRASHVCERRSVHSCWLRSADRPRRRSLYDRRLATKILPRANKPNIHQPHAATWRKERARIIKNFRQWRRLHSRLSQHIPSSPCPPWTN